MVRRFLLLGLIAVFGVGVMFEADRNRLGGIGFTRYIVGGLKPGPSQCRLHAPIELVVSSRERGLNELARRGHELSSGVHVQRQVGAFARR